MKNSVLPDNWPIPNEYLIELGRISALWGSLESSLNIAINKLAGYEAIFDWRSAVLTAHINFKQRLDMLSALCDGLQNEYPHLSNCPKVMEHINKAQIKRNKYMHNSIALNEDSGKFETFQLSARGKLKTNTHEVTLTDLREVSASIHVALLNLHELITQNKILPIWERDQ